MFLYFTVLKKLRGCRLQLGGILSTDHNHTCKSRLMYHFFNFILAELLMCVGVGVDVGVVEDVSDETEDVTVYH